jgi:hypothetical protein
MKKTVTCAAIVGDAANEPSIAIDPTNPANIPRAKMSHLVLS